MENASKALLIAAEILIAALILVVAVILITNYRNKADNFDIHMGEQQIQSFNTQFTQYFEYNGSGDVYISAQNLYTIVALATELEQDGTGIENYAYNIKVGTSTCQNSNFLGKYKVPNTSSGLSSVNWMYVTKSIGGKNQTVILYYKLTPTSPVKDSYGRITLITVGSTSYYKDGSTFKVDSPSKL